MIIKHTSPDIDPRRSPATERRASWRHCGGAIALLLLAGLPSLRAAPVLRATARLEQGGTVRIACFGDSVTGVYYHTGTRRAWCDLLGLALRQLYPRATVEMIHAGVSGNDTADGLKRMERDVLAQRPDLVVAMFGLNDARSQTLDAYRANLRTMVERTRAAGAEIMLMTPNAVGPDDPVRPPAKVAEYVAAMRDVARQLDVPLVDAYTAFGTLLAADPVGWRRLMSDTIHPNMRGHRIFALEVARVLSGRMAALADLPPLRPGLPSLRARLDAGQPVRVTAMTPFDRLIGPAIRAYYPDAVVEVTPWQPDPHALPAIEAQARALGWEHYRRDPKLAPPDLVVVAIPPTAEAPTPEQFDRSYTWTINWSLSSGMKPGVEWDAWVMLPSVAAPERVPPESAVEQRARDLITGNEVPWLARRSGDARPALELLTEALGQELGVDRASAQK